MERTVPSTASEEVELYQRTYFSLLRSTADVPISSLEEVHAGMNALLHPAARQPGPDMSAFIYSVLRLPPCMTDVQRIILGQSMEVFRRRGFGAIESWEEVSAPARRRRCFFDGQGTLACFIASRTDIDDVIPLLTAYQIEWNKFHDLLRQQPGFNLEAAEHKSGMQQSLADLLQLSLDDLGRLRAIWGAQFTTNLRQMAAHPRALRIQLLSGSYSEYRRATNLWWEAIEAVFPAVKDRPLYFISSNTHSIPNLLSGFALQDQRPAMFDFLKRSENAGLQREWQEIEALRSQGEDECGREQNFLYYLLKKYQSSPDGQGSLERQRQLEADLGMLRFPSLHSFDVEAQVIELSRLSVKRLDPRLCSHNIQPKQLKQALAASDALIINIDYPLGLAAYNILSEVADQAGRVLGIYVMGKAASLNAAVGDIMIPNVVHDEHSKNTYLFANCFASADVSRYMVSGNVLDNQKAVTVRGTFLQNATYMDVFYREGYTDIEMEAGPYLSAVYEMYRPQRHPANELVNLYSLPYDLGFLHYVSDTPLSKGRNLGVSSLSYGGMDSTYAASVAILRRIFAQEIARI